MYQRKAKFSNSSVSFSSYEDYLEESQEAYEDEYQGGFKKNLRSTCSEDADTRKYPVKKPKKVSREQREAKRLMIEQLID